MPMVRSCEEEARKSSSQEPNLLAWADILRPIRLRKVGASGQKGVGLGMSFDFSFAEPCMARCVDGSGFARHGARKVGGARTRRGAASAMAATWDEVMNVVVV